VQVSGRQLAIVIAGWLAVPGAATAGPSAPAGAPLRGVEIDHASLAPLTRATMRRELGLVLASVPLAVSWRTAPAGGETRPDELSLVFLSMRGVGRDRGALASTANQGPVRTTWVYVPTVLATLELDPESVVTSFEAQRQLGVALGRVLAHEIVHAVAPAVEHAGTGLMRPRLNAFELVRARPVFEADSAERIAAGARDWLTQGALPAPSLPDPR
jgi:hypothetical protein